MPSNADLITEITALAEKLGETVVTADLNNKELVALLSSLKAKDRDPVQADADAKAKQEANAAAKAEAEAKTLAKVKKPDFTVAAGKSITSKRGIIEDGAEVKAEDLPGGIDALQKLVAADIINDNR